MVREFGGEVLTDALVQKIIVENGRAVGVRVGNTSALAACSGAKQASVPLTEIRAKNIVWASGIYNLYGKALPRDLPQVLAGE
jgi:flavin-dependent dehydrogenase